MTQRFPHTISQTNITVFVSGQVVKMPKTHMGFRALAEHLQKEVHDAETILSLADKREALARLTAGKVTVMGNTVYYAGVPVHDALATRLVQLVDMGHDATPWALFMDKLHQNPSEGSKERLYEFIDAWDVPLSPDGDFIVFKGVRQNYTDVHSGTFDNSPGQTVEQARDLCVEDPNVHCAAGLHVCASHYLDGFWGSTSNRVIACKVNPRDVVSVPHDYKLSKMRTCRYVVLGDIEDERHRTLVEQSQIVTTDETGRVTYEKQDDSNVVIDEYETNERHAINGINWIETDADFCEGDFVLLDDGHFGRVAWYETLTFSDTDHPEYDDWVNGDRAGYEIDDVLAMGVDVEDQQEQVLVTWDECADWPGAVLVPDYDFEEQLEVDIEDEILIFTHDATGRQFSAPQLVSGVQELGQRGFARKFNIPRTTVQEWLKRAEASGY